ncbi:hypothetical protein CONPUDRAFT_75718 [Coniophora puteana RWD-64-598 SS2]|uniref:DUF6534 domain-containing protein n=1 Tax=Coniophora puteana (strain RWD-64-598) TaxID=741705 RepID=A0A5M3MGB5_CONPW|nr:uncharacterized protein CONPUDRAFT_75718 [Coniophora puteana RWD-64-598 SS2]EIW77970.1 hypothetical protein CONPUDRAFT_75718 [Coniophora puteana RWD-64-598 SS2]
MSTLGAQISTINGPLEVGTLASAILLGLTHVPCSVVDILYFFCNAWSLWMLTIMFTLVRPQLNAVVILTATLNILIQPLRDMIFEGFYAYRLWRLSHSLVLPAIIAITTATSTALNLYTAYGSLVYGSLSSGDEWHGGIWTIMVIDGCDIAGSLFITGGTAWYLRRSKTWALRGTARRIDKLIMWTFEIGLPPSICRIAELVFVLGYRQTEALWLGPFTIVGGVQANCLLAAINTRMMWCKDTTRIHIFPTNATSELPLAEVRYSRWIY